MIFKDIQRSKINGQNDAVKLRKSVMNYLFDFFIYQKFKGNLQERILFITFWNTVNNCRGKTFVGLFVGLYCNSSYKYNIKNIIIFKYKKKIYHYAVFRKINFIHF